MKRISLPTERKQIKNRAIYKGRLYYYVTTEHPYFLIQASRTKYLDKCWKKNPIVIYYILHMRYFSRKITPKADIQLIKSNNYTKL